MNNSKVKGALILFLALTALLLLFQGWRKKQMIEQLESEIRISHAQLQETKESLVLLRKVAADFLYRMVPETVPEGGETAWCEQRVNFPYMPDDFKRAWQPGKFRIPLEMKLPVSIRYESNNIIPGIAPYQINLTLNGTMDQFVNYLTELQRQYSNMLITKMALNPTDTAGGYIGKITLAIPKINSQNDLQMIQQLAQSTPKQVPTDEMMDIEEFDTLKE